MRAVLDSKVVATKLLALVGNPNVGKSVVFGNLTGRYVTVSNYPGTTVDVSRGAGWFAGEQVQIVDTPGILSLFPKSEDERVTRDLLLRERPWTVIQVADAKNLARSLLVTLELGRLGIPMVLALNMSDEARQRGIEIDAPRLSKILGVPVVETVATTKEGMAELRRAVSSARVPSVREDLLAEAAEALDRVVNCLPVPVPAREFVAESLLYGDATVWKPIVQVSESVEREGARCMTVSSSASKRFARPIRFLILDSRQQKAREIAAEVVQVTGATGSTWAQAFGRLSMRPWPGYLIAAGALYILYQFVGVFAAQTLVDIFENVLFGKILNPAVIRLTDFLVPVPFLREMIVGPYGLFTMAVTYALALILPIVTCFFLFFGILEDSGYLPRLAIMLDRAFRTMGLNGKAVLPMILGLGCDTMATLTTRVLDSRKEKIIVSLLLTLSVPCSAQLGAMLGMTAGLSWKVLAIWFCVVAGTMVLVGWGAARILPGVRSPFLMEIPPIRIPQAKNLYKKIRARLGWYLREAVPLFLLATFVLFVMDKTGMLVLAREAAQPIVQGILGLPAAAADSFIIGFLRRDYGAAGFFMLAQNGLMDPRQTTVALVVITLFMPCVAHFLMTIKERGLFPALAISAFVFAFSIAVGGLLNLVLKSGLIGV